MKLDVTTVSGAKGGSVEVPDELFGIVPNLAVLHQVVTAQVLEVDVERKRISLSLKALMARPEEPKPAEEPPPEPQRRKKGPLKGGTGSSAPTGLFGNPSDYR